MTTLSQPVARRGLGDRGLLIILLLLLGAIVIVERVIATRNEQNIPLSSTSNRADGASVMFLWLEELGYELINEPQAAFEVPENVGLTFLLAPSETVTDDEWATLSSWVEDGGILIISGSNPIAQFVYTQLGYGFFEGESFPTENARFQINSESPFLNTLNSFDLDDFELDEALNTLPLRPETDQVVHLSANGKPLVVSHPIGRGHVILAPETSLFSNKGLSGSTNRNVLLSLIAQQETGQRIWVDEWHHGIREVDFQNGAISGPIDWLRFTPSGRAVLLVCLLLLVFMLFNGRHLGRPDPLRESLIRRGPADYVDAMATLTRQTGDTDVVAQHSYQRLRRVLTKRYRLDPNLGDQALVETIQRIKSPEMAEATAGLLNRLKQKGPSESDLISLQSDIDQFIDENF